MTTCNTNPFSGLLHLRGLLLLFVSLSAATICSNLCLGVRAAVTAVIVPSEPLLNVPFHVTASFLKEGQNLYMSRVSTCDRAQVAGAICTLPSSRTCEFTVSGTSVNVSAQYDSEVPLLYLCSSAFSTVSPIQTVQLSVIDAMPRYVITGAPFTVTLNKATPVGTVIGFFSDDFCKNSISDMPPVRLDSDRQITLTVLVGDVIRLCAKVSSSGAGASGGSLTSYVPASTLLAVKAFSVDKTRVLRHTTEEFYLSPFSQIPMASFSPSSTCVPLRQEPVAGHMLQRVLLPIHVPRGSYYLCTGLLYYMTKRLYVPSSNLVSVNAYGLQPHTMYAGLSTTMTLTLDAAAASSDVMSIALFSSSDCQTDTVISWSTTRTWSVSSSGVYYACVKSATGSKTAVLAATITVMGVPIISLSRSPAIRGLPLTATLNGRVISNPGIITVGLSLTTACSNLVTSGSTTSTGTVATFYVPQDAFQTMVLCVSTPLPSTSNKGNDDDDADRGYVYSQGTVTTRKYNTSYGPLFVGVPQTLTLDSTVRFDAGTTGIFARGSCDNASGKPFAMDGQSINNVVFDSAGVHLLCVKVAGPSPSSTVASSYTPIDNILVYGPINLSPYSLVINVLTTVQVSLIPANAPVRVLKSDDCNAVPLVEGSANSGGEAKLQISHSKEAQLTVCVGYRGSDDQMGWSVLSVGKLPVTQVTVLPNTIITAQVNRVNFIVPDKTSLAGLQAFIVPGEAGSCGQPPVLRMNVNVPSRGRTYILFTPSSSTAWTVCLSSTSNTFTSVGTITSVAPLEVVAGSLKHALGLPIRLQFGGSSLLALQPTHFFLTDTPKSCARVETTVPPVYAEGTMDATTGEINAPGVAQVGGFTICVGWQDGEDKLFVYGTEIQVERFKAISRYAIREARNNLIAAPLLVGSTLFLVACAPMQACKGPITDRVCRDAPKRYYTSSIVSLTGAAVGQYVLCQEDTREGGVVASENLIDVVNRFVVTFAVNEVRQYKPVSITLSGGDMNVRSEPVTISTMPPGVNCGSSHAQRQDFIFPSSQLTGNITVTSIEPFAKGVQLCLIASPDDVLPVAVFDLLPYMTPSTVVTDRKVSVRSSMWKAGVVVKLTAAKNCAGITNSEPVVIHNYVSEFFVDGCSSENTHLTKVYYCESRDGVSAYEVRGMMNLIRLRDCAPDRPSAITPVTVPPSRPVSDYGIDTTLLMDPILSRTSDCQQLVQPSGNTGYTPRYDEAARFFVCVRAKGDSEYQFTTDTPTLTVVNHIAVPTSIPSQVSASVGVAIPTVLRLNYNTGKRDTYLSHSTNCSSTIASTPGLGNEPPSSPLLLVGISGIKYVCVVRDPGIGGATPAAEVLVVNPPQAIRLDPALVRGAPFRATLQVVSVDGQLPPYSLVPSAVVGQRVASFYTSHFSGVYLSGDSCRRVVGGTEVTYADVSGRIAIPTASVDTTVSSFTLCAGTPAGNLTVEVGIKLSTDIIFPSKFVVGADSEVYVPLSPTSVFHLRRKADCSGSEIVPSFPTNEESRGVLSFKSSSGNELPPSGKWTLCVEEHVALQAALSAAKPTWRAQTAAVYSLRPLTTIQVFDPVYYNIRGTITILGVPGVSFLMAGLTADRLLPGFSLDKSCKNRGETYGYWSVLSGATPTNSERISINVKEPMSPIYICATTPVNNSIVAIPYAGAFAFLLPTMSIPSMVSRCKPIPLDSYALPGSAPPTAFLVVIKGDCCNVADRGNIVGSDTKSADGHYSLIMDPRRLNAFSSTTSFAVCAVDETDLSYCATLGYLRTNEDVCDNKQPAGAGTLSTGVFIALSVLVIILVLLLIAVVLWFLRCRRSTRGKVEEKDSIGPRAMNPLRIDGPLMLEVWGAGDAHRTITITPSTDRVSSVPTTGTDMRLWEDVESDAREQLALQEARDRYHMRIAIAEGLERLRVAAKERDLLFELSGDDEREDNVTFADGDMNYYNSYRVLPGAVGHMASAPPAEQSTFRHMPYPPVEVPVTFTDAPSAYASLVFVDGLDSVVSRKPRAAASVASSLGSLSYTTTQRFHDECRFTLGQEAVRRQRILNWEEEELHAIIDAEFSSYVCLHQSLKAPPAPPDPDVVLLPFAAAFTEVVVTNDSQGEEDEDDIYDAPDIPEQMTKHNNTVSIAPTISATTPIFVSDIPGEVISDVPMGCGIDYGEVSPCDSVFSGSLSPKEGMSVERGLITPTHETTVEVYELEPTPEVQKQRLQQEELGEEGGERPRQKATKLKRQQRDERHYMDPFAPHSTPLDEDHSVSGSETDVDKTPKSPGV